MTSRILIIDDEADHAEIVALLLRRKGYEVAVARGGDEGLQTAQACQPSLILLDLFMPTMDGISTAENLRGHESTKEVPIIFLSACAEYGSFDKSQVSGRVTWLAKPFRAAELLWAVEDAIGPPAWVAPVAVSHAP